MRRKKFFILLIIFFIILYYFLDYLYTYINGVEVYVAKTNIKLGETITLDNVYKTKVSKIYSDNIESNPINQVAKDYVNEGKIIFKDNLCSKDNIDSLNKQMIAIKIEKYDSVLVKYILEEMYVNLYYIDNLKPTEISKIYEKIKVVDIYDENGNSIELNYKSAKVDSIVIEVDKEVAKEIKVLQTKGTFEISV